MKLLMMTRKVGKDDPTYSFIYGWVKSFASRVEKLYVICLEKGDTAGLPANTSIYSLGKEEGNSRLARFWRFQKLAWRIVPQVDGIFSHQNPEYGLLVAPYAKIFHKNFFAWYVHRAVTWKLKLLNLLADKMISINKESFRLSSRKVVFLHHGINTEKFVYREKEFGQGGLIKLLTVSRIAPSKNIKLMIETVAKLNRIEPERFKLDIYGEAITPEQTAYLEELKQLLRKLNLAESVVFHGGVLNDELPRIYQTADIFLNFSDTGSVDKTVLEAMSCGTLVLTTNEAFREILNNINKNLFTTKDRLIESISFISKYNKTEVDELAKKLNFYVREKHSLDELTKAIIKLY